MNFLSKSYLRNYRRLSECYNDNNTQVRLVNSSRSAIRSAIDILNLSDKPNFNPRELRDAYFAEAKLCHPDSNTKRSAVPSEPHKHDSATQFHRINEAYDLLLKYPTPTTGFSNGATAEDGHSDDTDDDFSHIVSKSEEQFFREACREYLGVDAETVEESKRCPLFREWLKGRSDAAFHWNNFFMLHGGLAPMLDRRRSPRISEDGEGRRRRRKSHSPKSI